MSSNGCVALGLFVLFLVLSFALPGQADLDLQPASVKRLRVVVFGAHPDDPESGCGGLIALLTKEGHEVTAAYATCFRGDRKIGVSQPEELTLGR
jgi:hypothetical protein